MGRSRTSKRSPAAGAAEAARRERIRSLAARAAQRSETFPPVPESVLHQLSLILHPGRGDRDE
jgi:hypothetical protein